MFFFETQCRCHSVHLVYIPYYSCCFVHTVMVFGSCDCFVYRMLSHDVLVHRFYRSSLVNEFSAAFCSRFSAAGGVYCVQAYNLTTDGYMTYVNNNCRCSLGWCMSYDDSEHSLWKCSGVENLTKWNMVWTASASGSCLLASFLTESHLSLGCSVVTSHIAAITVCVLLSCFFSDQMSFVIGLCSRHKPPCCNHSVCASFSGLGFCRQKPVSAGHEV